MWRMSCLYRGTSSFLQQRWRCGKSSWSASVSVPATISWSSASSRPCCHPFSEDWCTHKKRQFLVVIIMIMNHLGLGPEPKQMWSDFFLHPASPANAVMCHKSPSSSWWRPSIINLNQVENLAFCKVDSASSALPSHAHPPVPLCSTYMPSTSLLVSGKYVSSSFVWHL